MLEATESETICYVLAEHHKHDDDEKNNEESKTSQHITCMKIKVGSTRNIIERLKPYVTHGSRSLGIFALSGHGRQVEKNMKKIWKQYHTGPGTEWFSVPV